MWPVIERASYDFKQRIPYVRDLSIYEMIRLVGVPSMDWIFHLWL